MLLCFTVNLITFYVNLIIFYVNPYLILPKIVKFDY